MSDSIPKAPPAETAPEAKPEPENVPTDNTKAAANLFEDILAGKLPFEQSNQQLIQSGDQIEKLDEMIKSFPAGAPGSQVGNPNAAASSSGSRQKSTPWTEEEDQRLKVAIQHFGSSNWGAIATAVGNNRTRAQCSQRWNRVLNPAISKANWTEEEEVKLIQLVAMHGNKAWKRISSEMNNRSDVQCRFKYMFLSKKGDPRISHRNVEQIAAPSHHEESKPAEQATAELSK